MNFIFYYTLLIKLTLFYIFRLFCKYILYLPLFYVYISDYSKKNTKLQEIKVLYFFLFFLIFYYSFLMLFLKTYLYKSFHVWLFLLEFQPPLYLHLYPHLLDLDLSHSLQFLLRLNCVL